VQLDSGAALDEHLGDNMIPIIGLTKGRIRVSRITEHLKSNIYVCENFLDVKYTIDEKDNIITAE
jgi:RNA 3'-terminal phosphate cyclase